MNRLYSAILVILLGSGVGCVDTIGYGTRHRTVYGDPYSGYASANTRLDVQVQSSYLYGYDGYGYGYGRRSSNYGRYDRYNRYDRYDSSAARPHKDRTPAVQRPPSNPARPTTPSTKTPSAEARVDAERRAQIRVMTNPVPFSPRRQQQR